MIQEVGDRNVHKSRLLRGRDRNTDTSGKRIVVLASAVPDRQPRRGLTPRARSVLVRVTGPRSKKETSFDPDGPAA